MSDAVELRLLQERFPVDKCTIVVEIKAIDVVVPPEKIEVAVQTDDPRAAATDVSTEIMADDLYGRIDVATKTNVLDLSDAATDTLEFPVEKEEVTIHVERIDAEVNTLDQECHDGESKMVHRQKAEDSSINATENQIPSVSEGSIRTDFTTVDEDYDAADQVNPLLVDDDVEPEGVESQEMMSEVSGEEFQPREGYIDVLDKDDPRTILTWNSSGLQEIIHRRIVWDGFVELVKALKPDIVVIQNVKLVESPITGHCPKIQEKGDGRAVKLPYEQQLQDGRLIEDLKRGLFKRYRLVHSLACWRIGGQLVFVKNKFHCITERFCLNTRLNPKYHHPEGRSILLQFKSFNLLCVMSPANGWDTASVKQRQLWHRDLAHLLYDLKDTKAVILCGNLNCAPEDIDLSDAGKLKLENSPVLHRSDNTGYPGCRPADREGLRWIMLAGRLVDVFRRFHPYRDANPDEKNLKYTSLVYLGDKTRCAVRTNLTLMTHYFLKNVAQCDIIGTTSDLVSLIKSMLDIWFLRALLGGATCLSC
ncbi:DNA-(apurinic or apyrimidinic site) lyase [Babesia sp. Xinjiang]|uniref:DNA-(apurinic or apyrimidinic site) lyase n=1 Tax=Babesia sp. Xinjiang TaxID=462227 RepID=UPI000A22A4FE|nr:DNA-(apurinic or apyrimidinic site) lyase [Babesia sp. Xinjiang]ORM42370.1 DNA-(apurinic or apyrimidinic site) lyase [Babesia sp. Xinjiang]